MKFYIFLSKLLKFILNFIFVVQIILMLLVFFTAAYWFFHLLNSNLFGFAAPLADSISDFVKMYYEHDVILGGIAVDTSLILFDVAAIVLVCFLSWCKFYIYNAIERVDYIYIVKKKKAEKLFNEELQKEAEIEIKKYNNAVIVVEFDVRDMHVDTVWDGTAKKTREGRIKDSIKIFYSTIKSVTGCNLAKTGNRMAIFVNDFNKFDEIMMQVEQILEHIKENLKKKYWDFVPYIAVDTYYDNKDFKTDVYPLLKELLGLKRRYEVLCFGNFNLRYALLGENTAYKTLKLGEYNLNGLNKIYNLVKKN